MISKCPAMTNPSVRDASVLQLLRVPPKSILRLFSQEGLAGWQQGPGKQLVIVAPTPEWEDLAAQ